LLRELKKRLYDAYSQMRLQHYVSKDTGHFVNIINAQINGFLQAFDGMINVGKDLIMIASISGLRWLWPGGSGLWPSSSGHCSLRRSAS
jgi:hypothetical protein